MEKEERTTNKEKLGRRDLCDRTFAFAMRAMRVVESVPRTTGGDVLGRQLARCGTSVGANVEEAEAAQSRPDYVRKMNIARAEAREASYWLRLIGQLGLVKRARLDDLINEADQLIRILSAIVKKTRGTDWKR